MLDNKFVNLGSLERLVHKSDYVCNKQNERTCSDSLEKYSGARLYTNE